MDADLENRRRFALAVFQAGHPSVVCKEIKNKIKNKRVRESHSKAGIRIGCPLGGFKVYKGKTVFNNLKFKIINNGNSPCLLEMYAIQIDSRQKLLRLSEIKKNEKTGNYEIVATSSSSSKKPQPVTLEGKRGIEYFSMPLELNYEINKTKVEVTLRLAMTTLFGWVKRFTWKNYKFTGHREFLNNKPHTTLNVGLSTAYP